MRVVASLALVALLAAAKSPEPINLKPAAAWKIDYHTNSCVLSRQFTSGSASYAVQLTVAPVDQRAWLRIGSAEKSRHTDDGDAIVEVDGAKLAEPTHFNFYPNARGGTTREFLFEDFERDVAGTARTLRLEPERHGNFLLDVSDLRAAMRTMHSCMDDLHRSLGIDPALLRTIVAEPQGTTFSFVKSAPLPFDMQLLYWVAPNGRVDDCRVLAPTSKAEADTAVCDELKRKGRFKPAKNAAGIAIRAPVYEDVRMRVAELVTTAPM
ncbi:MAG: hypothetical protein ACJ8E3_01685 [Sphingomicrobium sp.]